jgi:hypothetical protein
MTSHNQYADYVDALILKESEEKLGTIVLKTK